MLIITHGIGGHVTVHNKNKGKSALNFVSTSSLPSQRRWPESMALRARLSVILVGVAI